MKIKKLKYRLVLRIKENFVYFFNEIILVLFENPKNIFTLLKQSYQPKALI